MNPLDLRGTWGPLAARLYERVVSADQDDLYRDILDLILPSPSPNLGDARPRSILDVGAGPGNAAAILAARYPDARVIGLDSSPDMVRLATARAARNGLANASFVVGDALSLPFSDGSFDLVYSIASIKHWSDPGAGLAQIHRVLTTGGRMAVVEADRGARAEVVKAYARRWRWVPAWPAAVGFRLFIGGNSLDPFDAEAILRASPFREGRVERLTDMPLFAIRADRR